jgi:hypothetical protein
MVSLVRASALWVAAALLCVPLASHADDEAPTESFGAGEKQLDGSYLKPAEDGEAEHYLISTPDGTQVIHYPEGKYVVVSVAADCPNPTFLHRETKECRPDSTGDLVIHKLEYLEYICPKPPKKRRVVIAVVPTDDPCTEGAYYRDRALSEDNFGEKWPRLPEKEVEEKPPEPPGNKPPPEKKPPSYGTGKIHNPLGTTDCAQKRLWELWFKAFAEGKTPKDAVDIPLVPWSKYTYGKDGTGSFESPEGSTVEVRPDGSVWEKPKGGSFKQICPPKTEKIGEPPAKPKETEEQPPKEEEPKDDNTGQAPKCEPGALAGTLNDLLGTELEGVCEDDTLGDAEGHGDGDGEGHGGME